SPSPRLKGRKAVWSPFKWVVTYTRNGSIAKCEAAAEGEHWFPRVAGAAVLGDRIGHILAVQRVLQLRGEQRKTVGEQHEVEAVSRPLAIPYLPHDRELVDLVQHLRLGVQPGLGLEERQPELAAGRLHLLAHHGDGAIRLDRRGDPLEELVARGLPM